MKPHKVNKTKTQGYWKSKYTQVNNCARKYHFHMREKSHQPSIQRALTFTSANLLSFDYERDF